MSTAVDAPPVSRAWRALRGIAIGLVLLALLEGGLRLFAPQPPRGFSRGLFEQHAGLSRMRPGSHGTQIGREFSVTHDGDLDGYRAGLSSARSPAVERVWLFGDSFAFGWGVEAGATFSARLVQSGLGCANRAIPGDGVAQYRARLEQMIASGERPRAIVVLLYDNDLVEGPLAEPSGFRVRSLLLRSHLVRLLARGLDRAGGSRWAAEATGFRSARLAMLRRDLALHRPGALDLDEKLEALRGLLTRAAEIDVPVTLLRIVPVYAAGGAASRRALEASGESLRAYDFEALDRNLRELARTAGAGFVRFGPPGEDQERAWYFASDLHLTAEGHAALAFAVARLLGFLVLTPYTH